jgi:hypothetical protein
MNATAVPWPETARSAIPTTTVASHAATPEGATANGDRRSGRIASQPAPRPARNGHAVDAMPPRVSPLA